MNALFKPCVIQIQVRVEEHLIIPSWFVVLLLCDENKSYIDLLHAQNMSRSKPKKTGVGHNPKRAKNSRVFVNPRIYSCAVDVACEQAPCEGGKKFGERSVNPAPKRVGVRA